ncbi:hypothetical protein Ahy_A07g036487 [Arachis hypogaea]|uniref:DUF4283 domain-containing protein n=1 Tax=Arachis hypogaea TaxID=3818 RepID=A0A445CGA5_ARAHY|nr:hypothetical protein Ahy_A07g036487 [Arachis hypogaea]
MAASVAFQGLEGALEVLEEDQIIQFGEEDIKEGLEKCTRSLVGRLMADRKFSAGTLEAALLAIWRQPVGFKILDHGGNVFQLFFEKEIEMIRIENGAPWLFKNYILNLKRWKGEDSIVETEFLKVPIWIQLWGLPEHCKTKELGRKLGRVMGEVMDVDLFILRGKEEQIVKVQIGAKQFGRRVSSQKENQNPHSDQQSEKKNQRDRKPTPLNLIKSFASLSINEANTRKGVEDDEVESRTQKEKRRILGLADQPVQEKQYNSEKQIQPNEIQILNHSHNHPIWVSELLLPDQNWNQELITSTFTQKVAQAIMNTSIRTTEDIVTWSKEKNECYSCPESENAWKIASLPWTNQETETWRWWLWLQEQLKERRQMQKETHLAAILTWQIWKMRNLKIFEAKVISPQEVVAIARSGTLEAVTHLH